MHNALTIPVSDKLAWCERLAESQLLPAQYRRRPADLLYALEYAASIGVAPLTAITGIHVIEGKPSASAALVQGLVRRAGHRLRVSGDDKQATCEIVRADDPDYTFRSTWTLERAVAAGLVAIRDGKPYARGAKGALPWERYTAAMLKARAVTECARDACAEALAGLLYTPEELGAAVDEDGKPLVEATVVPLRVVEEQPDWLKIAEEAVSVDTVRAVYAQAKQARADEKTLAAIADVGRSRAPQPASAPQTPAPGSQTVPPAVEPPATAGEPEVATLRNEAMAIARLKNVSDIWKTHRDLQAATLPELQAALSVLRGRCSKKQAELLDSLCRETGTDVDALRQTYCVTSRSHLTAADCSRLIDRLTAERNERLPPSSPDYQDRGFNE